MTARILFMICVVLIASLIAMGATAYVQKTAPASTTWEYKMGDDATEEQLNELGKQGWELTTVQDGPNSGGVHYYFKRPR